MTAVMMKQTMETNEAVSNARTIVRTEAAVDDRRFSDLDLTMSILGRIGARFACSPRIRCRSDREVRVLLCESSGEEHRRSRSGTAPSSPRIRQWLQWKR